MATILAMILAIVYDLVFVGWCLIYLLRKGSISAPEQAVLFLSATAVLMVLFVGGSAPRKEAASRWLFTLAVLLFYWQARHRSMAFGADTVCPVPYVSIGLLFRWVLHGLLSRLQLQVVSEGAAISAPYIAPFTMGGQRGGWEQQLRFSFLFAAALLSVMALFIHVVLTWRYPDIMEANLEYTIGVVVKTFEFALLIWLTSLRPVARVGMLWAGFLLIAFALLRTVISH